MAGHSLGEYNALFAAGAFDFITGLQLVRKRGELMSMATDGKMAAVMGLTPAQAEDALQTHGLHTIDIANMNSPHQVVISGRKEDIERAKTVFEGIKDVTLFHPLNVSGAFHSRYMSEAKQEFEKFLQSFHFLLYQFLSFLTCMPDLMSKTESTPFWPIRSTIQCDGTTASAIC